MMKITRLIFVFILIIASTSASAFSFKSSDFSSNKDNDENKNEINCRIDGWGEKRCESDRNSPMKWSSGSWDTGPWGGGPFSTDSRNWGTGNSPWNNGYRDYHPPYYQQPYNGWYGNSYNRMPGTYYKK